MLSDTVTVTVSVDVLVPSLALSSNVTVELVVVFVQSPLTGWHGAVVGSAPFMAASAQRA